MSGVFITATGTGSGKTFVARGLARALVRRGMRVAALKPIETGFVLERSDARALAQASDNHSLEEDRAWVRMIEPLAPYAATLDGGPAIRVDNISSRVLELARSHDYTIVEGAGGLLVPITRTQSMAELARSLAMPLVLVAPNSLGVLSHVLTAASSAGSRRLEIAAVVLSNHPAPDPSRASNARILRERLSAPIFELNETDDDNEALAIEAERSGLVPALVARAR